MRRQDARRSQWRKDDQTMRTFLALDMSDDAKDELTRISELLKGECKGSFCAPQSYHMTLAFLGEITQYDADILMDILEDELGNVEPFSLSLCRLGYFAQPESATVFCSTAKETRLEDLAALTYRAAWDCGIDFDAKRFRAHITLGRRVDTRGARLDAIPVGPVSFPVEYVTLYKSTLRPTGPIYERLSRVALKGRPNR